MPSAAITLMKVTWVESVPLQAKATFHVNAALFAGEMSVVLHITSETPLVEVRRMAWSQLRADLLQLAEHATVPPT